MVKIYVNTFETSLDPDQFKLKSPPLPVLSKFELSPLGNLVVTLSLLAAVVAGLPDLDFFGQTMEYLHLHAALELAAMACMLAAAANGLRHRHHPDGAHLVVLACGLVAVMLMDVFHVFSYEDMPLFITPSNPQKAINFWLAGRFWLAATLLAMTFSAHRALGARGVESPSAKRIALLMAANLVVAGVVFWVGIFYESSLPATFIAGQGLTTFKVAAELVVVAIFGLAAWQFFRMPKPSEARGINYRLLAAAAWVYGLAELFLCMYSDVTDVFNLAGHVYKVIGSMLLAIAAAPVAKERLAQGGTLARYLRS